MLRMSVRDKDWAKISHLFPDHKGKKGRPPKKDKRYVLEGILWVVRTGAPWRDMPLEFGPWETVYTQFRRWTQAGLWAKIMSFLRKLDKPNGKTILIDSTIIRAHQHAAGAKGGKKIRPSAAREEVSPQKFTLRSQKRDIPCVLL